MIQRCENTLSVGNIRIRVFHLQKDILKVDNILYEHFNTCNMDHYFTLWSTSLLFFLVDDLLVVFY